MNRRLATLLAAPLCAALALPAVAQQQQPQQRRPAQQQQQQQEQQQRPAPQPPQRIDGFASGWGRICQPVQGTDVQGCVVTQEVFGEAGNFLVSLAIQEARPNQRRQLIAIVPLGIAFASGILMRVDDRVAIPAKVGTCLPNGCFAGIDLGDDLLRPMRQGTTFFVTVRTAQGQALDLAVPLEGLAASADGQPLDQAAAQERQRRFQAEIERRQQAFRERMQQQQQQQAPQTPGQPAPAQPGQQPAPQR